MRYRFFWIIPFLFLFPSGWTQETLIDVPFTQPLRLEVDAGEDQILSGELTLTLGNDLIIEGGTADFQYQWTDPRNNKYYTPTITAVSAGTYQVTITDAENCTASDAVKVSGATSINEQVNHEAISIFPNPSDGLVHFQLIDGNNTVNLTVYSADGKIALSKDLDPLQHIVSGYIDFSGFDPGVYYIQVLTGTKKYVTSILIR